MDKIDNIKNENDLNKKLTTEDIMAKALHYRRIYDDCALAIDRLKASTQNDDQKSETQDPTAEIAKLEDKQEKVYGFYCGFVNVINIRGSDIEFEHCQKLSTSLDVNERRLAADILGELGYKDQDEDKYYEDAVLKLIELLNDKHEDVIDSVAMNLGKRLKIDKDFGAIQKLIELADHKNRHIRFSVTYALGMNESEHKNIIDTLISLSDDEDFEVKNWAIFALGSQKQTDTPEVRAVLKKYLNDEDYEIRGEALVGLAERGDRSIVEAVQQELEVEIGSTFAIKASELLADPLLLDPLIRLKNQCDDEMSSYFMGCLDRAIEACSQ